MSENTLDFPILHETHWIFPWKFMNFVLFSVFLRSVEIIQSTRTDLNSKSPKTAKFSRIAKWIWWSFVGYFLYSLSRLHRKSICTTVWRRNGKNSNLCVRWKENRRGIRNAIVTLAKNKIRCRWSTSAKVIQWHLCFDSTDSMAW